ncbi:MAG: adenylyltransferase/cytidyltransferase family protein [bacterium]
MKTRNIVRLLVMGIVFGCTSLQGAPSSAENKQSQKKPVRVYIDMVGDLFHVGHIQAIKKARVFGDYLIVGVCGDEECTSYKRLPILTLEERVAEVQACRYVDEVITDAPVAITDQFINKHKIDIVVHGDDFDQEKMRKYYGAAMDRGILRIVPYTKGISTSDIIRRILLRSTELSSQFLAKK